MKPRNDPAGRRLPIKLDTATNGEYAPIPLGLVRAKILGLNALKIYPVPGEILDKHPGKDRLAVARAEYRESPA